MSCGCGSGLCNRNVNVTRASSGQLGLLSVNVLAYDDTRGGSEAQDARCTKALAVSCGSTKRHFCTSGVGVYDEYGMW